MPIYEFRCPRCGERTSLFQRQMASPPPPACSGCGEEQVRVYSPFAYHRSIADIHHSSGDPDRPGADYYNDPRNIGRWAEKRFKQMGVELPGQVQEMIQAAREGDMPPAAKDLQPNVKEI